MARMLRALALCLAFAGPAAAAAVAVDARAESSPGSYFLAVLDRAGLLSGLGHRHAVLASSWTATGRCDPAELRSCRFEIVVPAAALEIDSPAAEKLAGLEGRRPSPKDRRKIDAGMRRVLEPERHPAIRFTVSGIEEIGKADGALRCRVRGELTLKGRTAAEEAAATVIARDGTLVAEGSAKFKLSRYGIEPPTVAGVVKVADEAELRFRLAFPAR